jgi:tetratricopeptide (TPR) repeat protein
MRAILVILAVAVSVFPVQAQTAAQLIASGDSAYARFDDQAALAQYKAALALEPSNYEALYKASRALVNIADVITATDKEAGTRQMKLYADAAVLARQAVAANSDGTWGHFLIAAADGKRLLMLGAKKQVDASREIKAEIDKALALDPANHLAWAARGVWYRRLEEIGRTRRLLGDIFIGPIPKGSYPESEKSLRRAVDLHPEFVNHYLELGRTLVDEKKYDEAARAFEQAIDLPKTTSEDDILKKQAKAELDKLAKRH